MCYNVLRGVEVFDKINNGCVSESELQDVQICYRVVDIRATQNCCVSFKHKKKLGPAPPLLV